MAFSKKDKKDINYFAALETSILNTLNKPDGQWSVYTNPGDLLPINAKTGTEYRGSNSFILSIIMDIRYQEAIKNNEPELVGDYFASLNHHHSHLFMTFNQMREVSKTALENALKQEKIFFKKNNGVDPDDDELAEMAKELKDDFTITLKKSDDCFDLSKGIMLSYQNVSEFWRSKKYKETLSCYRGSDRIHFNEIEKTTALSVCFKHGDAILKSELSIINSESGRRLSFQTAEKEYNTSYEKGFNVHSLMAMNIPPFIQSQLGIEKTEVNLEKKFKADGEPAKLALIMSDVKSLYRELPELGQLNTSYFGGNSCVKHPFDIDFKETNVLPSEGFVNECERTRSLLHELTHATGSFCGIGDSIKVRMGEDIGRYRSSLSEYHEDDRARAKEELIAEIGSILTCQALGISAAENLSGDFYENRISYLTSWARLIKDEPDFIKKGIKEASIASHFIVRNIEKARLQISLAQNEPSINKKELRRNKSLSPSM